MTWKPISEYNEVHHSGTIKSEEHLENVYLYSKLLQQPKYQQLALILQAVEHISYFPCCDNEAIVPPSAALQNSIFAFDYIACEKRLASKNTLAWYTCEHRDMWDERPHRDDKVNKRYKYMLTVIDAYSKFTWVRPVKSKNVHDVTKTMADEGLLQCKVGYLVSISKQKGIFEKGFMANWSTGHFCMHRICNYAPTTYFIEDTNILPIHGGWWLLCREDPVYKVSKCVSGQEGAEMIHNTFWEIVYDISGDFWDMEWVECEVIQVKSKFPLHIVRTCSGDQDGYVLHRNLCPETYRVPATNKTPPHHMLTSPASATHCTWFLFWFHLQEGLDVRTMTDARDAPVSGVTDARDAPVFVVTDARGAPVFGVTDARDAPVFVVTYARDAPVFGVTDARGAPVFGVADARGAPVFGVTDARGAPVFGVTDARDAPVFGVADARGAPVFVVTYARVTDARDAHVFGVADARGAPVFGVVDARDAPVFGVADARGAPVFGVADARGAPVFGVEDARGAPVFGVADARGAPVFGVADARGAPVFGVVDARDAPVFVVTDARGAPVFGVTDARDAPVFGVADARGAPVSGVTDARDAPVLGVADARGAPVSGVTDARDAPVFVVTYARDAPVFGVADARDAPVSGVTDARDAPVFGVADARGAPVFGVADARGAPVFGVVDARDAPVFGVADARGAPVFGVADARGAPVFGVADARGAPVFGVVDARDAPVFGVADARGAPVFGVADARGAPVFGVEDARGAPVFGVADARGAPVFGVADASGAPVLNWLENGIRDVSLQYERLRSPKTLHLRTIPADLSCWRVTENFVRAGGSGRRVGMDHAFDGCSADVWFGSAERARGLKARCPADVSKLVALRTPVGYRRELMAYAAQSAVPDTLPLSQIPSPKLSLAPDTKHSTPMLLLPSPHQPSNLNIPSDSEQAKPPQLPTPSTIPSSTITAYLLARHRRGNIYSPQMSLVLILLQQPTGQSPNPSRVMRGKEGYPCLLLPTGGVNTNSQSQYTS
ncbi:hypothetical protein PR048_020792 [Dryococelus australis]|uniref:Uncharacterized protein n=1 Tax=Dryococelus australis TaxID=614101 RepID=A0ABQ9GWE8_9NEOP|nr:hypothetical protein PR048_020792 [Dryococelus australis]